MPDSVFVDGRQSSQERYSAFRPDYRCSNQDRELAFANIKKAAHYYGVDMTETDWTQLGRTPHTGRTAEDRKREHGG